MKSVLYLQILSQNKRNEVKILIVFIEGIHEGWYAIEERNQIH